MSATPLLFGKKDFFVGYSPERINPGDKENNISNVIKLVSADSEKTLEIISEYYSKVVVAGLKPVNSIKAAEASKLLENIQRDVNISLINELALLFDKLDLDTQEILDERVQNGILHISPKVWLAVIVSVWILIISYQKLMP